MFIFVPIALEVGAQHSYSVVSFFTMIFIFRYLDATIFLSIHIYVIRCVFVVRVSVTDVPLFLTGF